MRVRYKGGRFNVPDNDWDFVEAKTEDEVRELAEMAVEDGYMIYFEGIPDHLRFDLEAQFFSNIWIVR